MDRHRFDALAKLLATTGSRRATLAALLGVSLFGHDPDLLAKQGKGGKGKGKGNDHGHGGQGVQGEGRPGAKHQAHHQHKQTQRQRRKKRDRQDRNDHGGKPNPSREDGVCCGTTRPCAPPTPGSDRTECDFDGQSFASQDLHGVIFRRIDGRGTSFDETDLHGALFAAACLRFATFRGAKLAGTT